MTTLKSYTSSLARQLAADLGARLAQFIVEVEEAANARVHDAIYGAPSQVAEVADPVAAEAEEGAKRGPGPRSTSPRRTPSSPDWASASRGAPSQADPVADPVAEVAEPRTARNTAPVAPIAGPTSGSLNYNLIDITRRYGLPPELGTYTPPPQPATIHGVRVTPPLPFARRGIEEWFGEPGGPRASAGMVELPGMVSLYTPGSSVRVSRFACHIDLRHHLQMVFDGLRDRDLWRHINAFGGCYNNRSKTASVRGASPSTHAWGIAVDLNPSTNGYGAVPSIHPSVVDHFESNGFEWGGRWRTPDGMHFQYARGY